MTLRLKPSAVRARRLESPGAVPVLWMWDGCSHTNSPVTASSCSSLRFCRCASDYFSSRVGMPSCAQTSAGPGMTATVLSTTHAVRNGM
jgi:hypothetical protein